MKPWLDKDMYFNMKENDEKVRINSKAGELPPDSTDIDMPIDNLEELAGDGIHIEE